MAPKSPKKKSSKPSKPRRCNRCSNRPLVSECIHTSVGRAHLAANGISPTPNSPEPPINQSSSPPPSSPTFQGGVDGSEEPPPASSHPTTPRSDEPPMSSIDPRLLEPTTYGPRAPPVTPTQILTRPTSGDVVGVVSGSTHNDAGQGIRNRITKTNATHGYVLGALRGAGKFEVLRTSQLKDPITESKKSSGRFARCMSEILVDCEQAASETGCWLFIAAQHSTARAPFVHYSSPRFVRESKQDMEHIINQFNQIFAGLLASRRYDAREIHGKLVEAQGKQAETEKRLEESIAEAESSKQAFDRQQRKLCEQTTLLEQYKERLAALSAQQ